MSEDNKKPQDGKTPKPPKEEGKDGGKTFSQEDIDKIVSERLEREREKFKKELESEKSKVQTEAERLAKLSEDEKIKELSEKQSKELADKEKSLTLRENKLIGIDKLNELKIPIRFVDFVLNEDKDQMDKNIDLLHEEWKKAISEEVANQLKGKPPKDPNPDNSEGKDTEIVKAF